jgi:aryl-alcohol dehydrogenase-like predicted oxidoreductase
MFQPKNTTQNVSLLLGTAQWGWNVSEKQAFGLLDAWLSAGYRAVDCATNYPINRNPSDFRAAEKILLAYVKAHGLHDLKITMKIGSMDNMRTPDINLAPSYVLMAGEEYLRQFRENLRCVMLHWDNRDDTQAISETLTALKLLQDTFGLRPGLSGIAHPELYAQLANEKALFFDIQMKSNVLQSSVDQYAACFSPQNHLFAYGINAGGVKLEGQYSQQDTYLLRGGKPAQVAEKLESIRALLPDLNTAFVRPPLKTMNHLGLVYAGLHPRINGILLGVSSVAQLKETLDFWRNLEVFDYSDAWLKLNKLALQKP